MNNSGELTRLQSASAGAIAAAIWGLSEPLDQRLFRCDYSDIAVLGKAVTRGRRWRVIGYGIHLTNGALFGLLFHFMRCKTRVPAVPLAVSLALVENVGLYPASYFVDKYHPARGQAGVPQMMKNPRVFAQETIRHALFGLVLGTITRHKQPKS